MREQAIYTLAIGELSGLGPVKARQLIQHFGSAQSVWEASAYELSQVDGLRPEILLNLIRTEGPSALLRSQEQLQINQDAGGQVALFSDDFYPAALSRCSDAPLAIFYKGQLPPLGARLVSVIGTRQMSEYGREATWELIKVLSSCGATVVSGLAYGIDIQAHRAALEFNIPTIAVLGCGLGKVYPQQHRQEAKQLQEKGALISEFYHTVKPDRENFPKRNRIVAGIAEATVVVEAGRAGGAWITARLANDYGREVLAIPGPWNSEVSKGCHDLIAVHAAAILPAPEDIPRILGWEVSAPLQERLFPADAREVALALARHGAPMHIDDLALSLQLPPHDVQALLFELELDGHIRALPGRFVKLSSTFSPDVQ
jgi:DNA processing protein